MVRVIPMVAGRVVAVIGVRVVVWWKGKERKMEKNPGRNRKCRGIPWGLGHGVWDLSQRLCRIETGLDLQVQWGRTVVLGDSMWFHFSL